MRWIGLTGGIATGKSTVTRLLRSLGQPVICADELAHEVVAKGTPGLAEVVAAFGPSVLGRDGELDRKRVGELIFANDALRSTLEDIIHPRVRALCLEKKTAQEEAGTPLSFYDVPLLFEKNMQGDFDSVVVVACARPVQRARLIARDGLSESEADRRLAAQLPIEEKVKRANHILNNNGTLLELENAVRSLLTQLLAQISR